MNLMISRLKVHLASIVFPPYCLHCEAPLGFDTSVQWCQGCLNEMVGSAEFRCARCGAARHRSSPFDVGCSVCQKLKIHFGEAIAIGNYQDHLQKIVLEMKRAKSEAIAHQLGRILAIRIQQHHQDRQFDTVVPMPIYWWKRIKRGFNASSVIAEGLSSSLRISCQNRALQYTRHTRKQGTLSMTARVQNVKGAIQVKKQKAIKGKRVLLVDDVMTSCATANEAAKVLMKSGAAEVSVAVAARGVGTS